jgi:hypothetical protein
MTPLQHVLQVQEPVHTISNDNRLDNSRTNSDSTVRPDVGGAIEQYVPEDFDGTRVGEYLAGSSDTVATAMRVDVGAARQFEGVQHLYNAANILDID